MAWASKGDAARLDHRLCQPRRFARRRGRCEDQARTLPCDKAASVLDHKEPARCPICIRRWCASKHNLPLASPKIAVR